MKKITTEIKIGIIFVLCLFVFIWGINFLKGQNIFSKNNHYRVIYHDIKGLTESSPVMVNGFQVGQVEKIKLLPNKDNNLMLNLAVSKKFKIPHESIAEIISSDIMGSKAIELVLSDSNKYHQNGDTLKSAIEPDLKDQISTEIAPLKARTENILSSMDSLMAQVFDKNSREDISQSFSNLEKTTQSLSKMVEEERKRLKKIFANLESISTNLEKSNKQIANTVNNISSVTDSIAQSNLKSTINNTNNAIGQLNGILEKINSGEGSMGMLVNNDTLYQNLESSTKNLDKLLEDMRLNPGRYVHFSVFGNKND